jgi:predicted DNA repair protein MutK
MAGASLLALLDDITSVLDDVATMTKVAAQKTTGVLGDDLALNAQQVSGVRAERELPVVWAVAVGSLKNKLMLVPAALAISAFIPWAVLPLLMLGGLYLCFEGVEKLAHRWLPHEDKAAAPLPTHPETPPPTQSASAAPDPAMSEAVKIKGAIRTDFVLSAEIIVIALGTVAGHPFITRLIVLSGIGLLMTVGVYGLVAAIVKMDDAGLYLQQRANTLAKAIGKGLLLTAPRLMKTLAVVGTVAMFMVGGGILTHGLPFLHHGIAALVGGAGFFSSIAALALDVAVGIVAGLLTLLLYQAASKLRGAMRK